MLKNVLQNYFLNEFVRHSSFTELRELEARYPSVQSGSQVYPSAGGSQYPPHPKYAAAAQAASFGPYAAHYGQQGKLPDHVTQTGYSVSHMQQPGNIFTFLATAEYFKKHSICKCTYFILVVLTVKEVEMTWKLRAN